MSKKLLGILIFILLAVGVVAAVILSQQSTENRQHASSFNDLNAAEDITQINNADGTMGPPTWLGNFSNTLPSAYLGTLSFRITDPEQGQRPTLPTQAQGGGPQTVTSLTVVISKVEVHLARLGVPGAKNSIPSVTPGSDNNQQVDKWETLNIGGTKTVDVVALAKTHDFSVLGLTKLANGMYTEVRLYVSNATAVLSDGTPITLSIPGRANIIRVVEPFTIDSGKTTTLTMDFDAQNSVIKAGTTYLLKPVVARFDVENQ